MKHHRVNTQRIPIIVNPYSKRNKQLRGCSSDIYHEIGRDLVDVRPTGNLDQLDSVARECKENSVPYIAISGGDGTIHQVLSRFIQIYGADPVPPVLILKDGTMNNIAQTINLKGDGCKILKRFVRQIEKDRPFVSYARDTMKINDKYCFLFGAGLTTNILNAVYEGDSKDLPKVVMVMIRAFNEGLIRPDSSSLFKRFRAKVFLNDEELECNDLLGILAGTVEDIGMGFRPLTRQKSGERTFHVIATGVKPLVLAKNLLILKKGKPISHPLHYDSHVRDMKIVSESPFEYTMDGDLYFAERDLHVGMGPEVRFIYV